MMENKILKTGELVIVVLTFIVVVLILFCYERCECDF